MRNYKNVQKLSFKNLDLNKEYISINTHLDTLLHLINIDKNDAKEKQVLEQMIYDTVDYGKYVTVEDSIIAKHLNFTLAFIRETGSSNSSEKYMYIWLD